jgi:hypothetical protein
MEGWFPLFEAVPTWQRAYIDALRVADWPPSITGEDSGVLFTAERIAAVFLDVMFDDQIAEVLRADYDGDQLWLGEDPGSHEL